MNRAFLILVLAVLVGCGPAPTSPPIQTSAPAATAVEVAHGQFTGKCVAVHDGDTITVLHDGKGEKIRLAEIDCPELGQAFGKAAKQFASDLVFGKEVTVKIRDHDRYGRTVGTVVLQDGRILNRELLTAGLAWWYRAYSKDKALGVLEAEAREAKRGLWADENPTPPWEFRRKARQ